MSKKHRKKRNLYDNKTWSKTMQPIIQKLERDKRAHNEMDDLFDDDDLESFDSNFDANDDFESFDSAFDANDDFESFDSAFDANDDFKSFDDDTWEDFTEEDTTEDVIVLPAEAILDAPLPPQNKKAITLSRLAGKLIYELNIKVLNGETILIYDSELGYFKAEKDPIQRIRATLPPEIVERLTMKDCNELKELIRTSGLDSVQISADDVNNQEELINCENGVVNWVENRLLPHSSSYYFTYRTKAQYLTDKNILECPIFEQFCLTSLEGDPEKRMLLLEIIGYCLCDSNAGKCAMFLKGEPDSGKSIISEFIAKLFDPEQVSNIPLHKLSERFNKAELFGKKVNIAGEITAKKIPEISTFKSVTGGDRISAEFKGEDIFSFTPRCKLLFAGNALPGTTEADATKAFANRLVVLLFNQSIPKEEQDKELGNKLWEERDAIVTLAIQALRELHERNYQFTLPQESRDYITAFSDRENSVQAFVNDRCELGEELRVFNVDLLDTYHEYCAQNGLEEVSKGRFYAMLDSIPGVCAKRLRIGKENRWGRKGIAFRR